MAYMSEAEAERLDDYYTKNTIVPVGGKIGVIDRLKQNLRPDEPLFTKCIILKDDELDGVFADAPEIEERDLATAANA